MELVVALAGVLVAAFGGWLVVRNARLIAASPLAGLLIGVVIFFAGLQIMVNAYSGAVRGGGGAGAAATAAAGTLRVAPTTTPGAAPALGPAEDGT